MNLNYGKEKANYGKRNARKQANHKDESQRRRKTDKNSTELTVKFKKQTEKINEITSVFKFPSSRNEEQEEGKHERQKTERQEKVGREGGHFSLCL